MAGDLGGAIKQAFSKLGKMAEKEYLESINAEPLDELGYPKELPSRLRAPRLQYRADRVADFRNQDLVNQAIRTQRESLYNLQGYRPGGAAALMSGHYNSLSNLILQKRQGSPDLMFAYREGVRRDAERAAERASRRAFWGQVAGGIGSLVGGLGGAALTAAIK